MGQADHKIRFYIVALYFRQLHNQVYRIMTPTAGYCDVILPATTFLEREDILSPGMNYLFYSGKVIDPPGNFKNDYDIFCELSERLGFLDIYSEGKTRAGWIEQFLTESAITDYEHFKQTGKSEFRLLFIVTP